MEEAYLPWPLSTRIWSRTTNVGGDSAGSGSGGSGNGSGGSDRGWLAKCPQCPQIQRMPGAEEAGVCDWCGHVLTKVEHAIKGPRQLQEVRQLQQQGT